MHGKHITFIFFYKTTFFVFFFLPLFFLLSLYYNKQVEVKVHLNPEKDEPSI